MLCIIYPPSILTRIQVNEHSRKLDSTVVTLLILITEMLMVFNMLVLKRLSLLFHFKKMLSSIDWIMPLVFFVILIKTYSRISFIYSDDLYVRYVMPGVPDPDSLVYGKPGIGLAPSPNHKSLLNLKYGLRRRNAQDNFHTSVSCCFFFVSQIKELSNVKEEVYGALDSFIAWELEFPLIVIKKALKTLEFQKEWKRIIQVIKWMLSKGQGQTMGTYYTLLNALAEDGRLEEAEELWTKIFSQYLESLPRIFFSKMISLYYSKGLNEKMFEVFADMEELGVRPDRSIVKMVGDIFQRLGMHDKYEKLHMKYPPPNWEYRYIKGKRVKIRVKQLSAPDDIEAGTADDGDTETEQFTGADNEAKTELVLEQLTVLDNIEDERVCQQIPDQDAV